MIYDQVLEQLACEIFTRRYRLTGRTQFHLDQTHLPVKIRLGNHSLVDDNHNPVKALVSRGRWGRLQQ